jgi:hypothetical protein
MNQSVKKMDEMSIQKQIVVLLISILFFLAWYFCIFRIENHNKLALAFSIVTILWLLTIFIRFITIRKYREKDFSQLKKPIIKLPTDIKCMIGDRNCKRGNINIWSIIHFVTYTIIGYYIPRCYAEILIISISCELLESGLGQTSKYITDPVINLLGYTIGSYFSKY